MSAISLWISFLGSPLSEAGKPKIYYNFVSSRDTPKNGKPTAAMHGIIHNRSANPAEHVIVTICTFASDEEPDPPSIVVDSGIEYSVLRRDKNFTTLKFELFPAHYMCILSVNRYQVQPPWEPPAPEFPRITSVSHKHGYGIMDR